MTASEIEALGGYYGATPKPADFEAFWQARMAEADAVPLDYTVTQAKEVPSWAISTAKTLPPWCSARCCLARDWRMSSARPRPSAPSTTICTAKKSGIFSPVMGTRRLQNLTICC